MKKRTGAGAAIRSAGLLLAVLSTVILWGCGWYLYSCCEDYQASVGGMKRMEACYVSRGDPSPAPDERPAKKKKKVKKARGTAEGHAPLQVDWEGISRETEGIIAWLDIPGLELSYPIVQGSDNEYYLHHNVEGEESDYGAIFLNCGNDSKFTDSHNILFGHNMSDGSMFWKINDYGDPATFQRAPDIYIYTAGGRTLCYRVFSVYQSPAGDVSFRYGNDLGSREYRRQLEAIRELSEYETGTIPDPDNPMLTLKTCNRRLDYGTRTSVSAILQWEDG